MKRFGVLAGLVAVLSATGAAAAAETPALCGPVSKSVATYRIEADTPRQIYSIGDVAKVKVWVRRNIQGEDLGPAPNVDVFAALTRGDNGIYAWGTTNDLGLAKLRFKVSHQAPIGFLDLNLQAAFHHVDQPCIRFSESGEHVETDFLRIVR